MKYRNEINSSNYLKIQEFLKNLSKFMKKSVLYNVEIAIITKATLKF